MLPFSVSLKVLDDPKVLTGTSLEEVFETVTRYSNSICSEFNK